MEIKNEAVTYDLCYMSLIRALCPHFISCTKKQYFALIKLIGQGWIWLHRVELFLPANKLLEFIVFDKKGSQKFHNFLSTQQDFESNRTYSRDLFKANKNAIQ